MIRQIVPVLVECRRPWLYGEPFFLQLLTKYDVDMDIVTGCGGHDFRDYAVNGSVRDAFRFLISSFKKVGKD